MSLNTTPAPTPATPEEIRDLAFKAVCRPGAGNEVTIVVGKYQYHYKQRGGFFPDLVSVSLLPPST